MNAVRDDGYGFGPPYTEAQHRQHERTWLRYQVSNVLEHACWLSKTEIGAELRALAAELEAS